MGEQSYLTETRVGTGASRSPVGKTKYDTSPYRFAIRKAVADPFREHCSQIGIEPRRKLEVLVVRWLARGGPLSDLRVIADPYSDENRSRFTIRASFAQPLVERAKDLGVSYMQLIEGIMLGYLIRVGHDLGSEVAGQARLLIQDVTWTDLTSVVQRMVNLASYVAHT